MSGTDLPSVEDTLEVLPQAPDQTSRKNQTPFHARRRQQVQLQYVLIIGGIVLGLLLVGGVLGACILSKLFS